MNFFLHDVKRLPAVMTNVRTERIRRAPARSHHPIKLKTMASTVAATVNKIERDRLTNHPFLYKRYVPAAINRTLNAVPIINSSAPLEVGSTRIPQVVWRSGRGKVEKTSVLTKINMPRSMFSGPMVL
jgi:hypothetical protein